MKKLKRRQRTPITAHPDFESFVAAFCVELRKFQRVVERQDVEIAKLRSKIDDARSRLGDLTDE